MVRAQAREDIKTITSNTDEWAKPALFTAPTGETATINVVHVKHRIQAGEGDEITNTRSSRATFNWQQLIDLGYPVLKNGEMNFYKHTIAVVDSTGRTITYFIREWFPDVTVGVVLCILGDKQ